MKCFIYHYSFPVDEKGQTPTQVLNTILHRLLDNLKLTLPANSFYIEESRSILAIFRLLIAGGDPDESSSIHHVFSLLNGNSFNDENIFDNDDNRFLCKTIN
jgi:hypothetical protein